MRTTLRVGLVAFVLSVLPSPATAGAMLIGLSSTFSTSPPTLGTLYDINTGTGAVTNPRNTNAFGVVGIAYRGVNNTLYGLTSFGGDLLTYNLDTGIVSVVGFTDLPFIEGDLAYDASEDMFYGIQQVFV
jgi:hypothetical protein